MIEITNLKNVFINLNQNDTIVAGNTQRKSFHVWGHRKCSRMEVEEIVLTQM
jgi:hypothetical protein